MLFGDESWIKVELSASVTAPDGNTAVVTVSASGHARHGPSDEDTEKLGEMARRFLEREVARFHRQSVRPYSGGGGVARSRTGTHGTRRRLGGEEESYR